MFFVSCVSYAFAPVHCCLMVSFWDQTDLLALVGDVYCIFVTFPCGILGQVWYLITSFPDLCRLSYFYRYHKNRKLFSIIYHRHSQLIVKYNIGLKTLLQQGISGPICYGDLIYKFERIFGKLNFSDQFKNITKPYKHVGYNLDIMRQSAPNHGL